LIGDDDGDLRDGHPGHVKANDRRGLNLKLWKSDDSFPNDRYRGEAISGGHTRVTPAHDGKKKEIVEVLAGRFYRCSNGKVQRLERGLGSRIGSEEFPTTVELMPDDEARWFRDDSPFARGTTLCRNLGVAPGDGYEYRILDTEQLAREEWQMKLFAPQNPRLRGFGLTQLLMSFQGGLFGSHGGHLKHRLTAGSDDYAYVRPVSPDDRVEWMPDPIQRTVVVSVFF